MFVESQGAATTAGGVSTLTSVSCNTQTSRIKYSIWQSLLSPSPYPSLPSPPSPLRHCTFTTSWPGEAEERPQTSVLYCIQSRLRNKDMWSQHLKYYWQNSFFSSERRIWYFIRLKEASCVNFLTSTLRCTSKNIVTRMSECRTNGHRMDGWMDDYKHSEFSNLSLVRSPGTFHNDSHVLLTLLLNITWSCCQGVKADKLFSTIFNPLLEGLRRCFLNR